MTRTDRFTIGRAPDGDRLHIGTTLDGNPFFLPADLGDKKIAVLAQSKKGKTYGLGCLMEEMVRCERPFIASDPANNLWGLRVLPDGRPSGLQVVIIGGDHADIPFDKDAGEKMAEALLSTPICAVIDLAFESMGAVRKFMGDFAGRLMRTKPEIPRVIILEEAPVLIPQKCRGPQMEICKAAVSKLATIGGNFNYGVIPASQRAATIDKDVLSQCEALIVMGMTHAADRKTVRDWIEAKGIEEQVSECFKELGSLKPGEAWYWNPGEDLFQRFTFRKRNTLHPREMARLGLKSSAIHLGDMTAFVDRVKVELTKTQVSVPADPFKGKILTEKGAKKLIQDAADGVGTMLEGASEALTLERRKIEKLVLENAKLRSDLTQASNDLGRERAWRQNADQRLSAVRKMLKPQYGVLVALFAETEEVSGKHPNHGDFEIWLEKAPQKGIRVMIESLRDRGPLTFNQLCTLAGVATRTGYNCLKWLKRNHVVRKDGNLFHLQNLQ